MWFILAFTSAVTDATRNILAKGTSKQLNPLVVTWGWVFFSLFLLIPLIVLTGIPKIGPSFWVVLAVRTVVDTIGLWLYVKALQVSDVSLALPMLAFNPVFLVLSGLVINPEELPTVQAGVGIILVMLGVYLLNLGKKPTNLLAPFQNIYKDKGALMMLSVAFLWGIAANLHKVGASESSAVFYTGIGAIALSFSFTLLCLLFARKDFLQAFSVKNVKVLFPLGILDGITLLLAVIAQGLTISVYVVVIRRLSIPISAFLAAIFYKENIRDRLVPILIILGGVVLVTLR